MDLNPDSAWQTDPVAIRPWAPTLSQHGLQQVVVRNLNGPRPRPRGTSKDEPVRGSRRPKSQAKMAGLAGQCTSTTTRSGAERWRLRNGGG